MEEKKLDFSVQSFWVACAASGLIYVICKIGIIKLSTSLSAYILNLILSAIAFIGYLWYKRSKVTSDVKLSGTDIFTAIISSAFAQGVSMVLMLIFGTETHAVPASPQEDDQDVYYENCTDAREQGATPVYSDDPGYSIDLDRDGDGIGCE